MSYPERIVPGEAEPGVDAVHLKRYDFAAPFCVGRRVLDAGCGVGYGSARLAETAASVVGVDVSEDAIGHAQANYGGVNVSFIAMDVAALDFGDASFDVVCSFETIEHVDDAERAYWPSSRASSRTTAPLVLSTPQVERTTSTPANPYPPDRILAHGLRSSCSSVHFESVEHVRTTEGADPPPPDRAAARRPRPAAPLCVRCAARRVLLGTTPTAELDGRRHRYRADGIERASELVAVCRAPRRPGEDRPPGDRRRGRRRPARRPAARSTPHAPPGTTSCSSRRPPARSLDRAEPMDSPRTSSRSATRSTFARVARLRRLLRHENAPTCSIRTRTSRSTSSGASRAGRPAPRHRAHAHRKRRFATRRSRDVHRSRSTTALLDSADGSSRCPTQRARHSSRRAIHPIEPSPSATASRSANPHSPRTWNPRRPGQSCSKSDASAK